METPPRRVSLHVPVATAPPPPEDSAEEPEGLVAEPSLLRLDALVSSSCQRDEGSATEILAMDPAELYAVFPSSTMLTPYTAAVSTLPVVGASFPSAERTSLSEEVDASEMILRGFREQAEGMDRQIRTLPR